MLNKKNCIIHQGIGRMGYQLYNITSLGYCFLLMQAISLCQQAIPHLSI